MPKESKKHDSRQEARASAYPNLRPLREREGRGVIQRRDNWEPVEVTLDTTVQRSESTMEEDSTSGSPKPAVIRKHDLELLASTTKKEENIADDDVEMIPMPDNDKGIKKEKNGGEDGIPNKNDGNDTEKGKGDEKAKDIEKITDTEEIQVTEVVQGSEEEQTKEKEVAEEPQVTEIGPVTEKGEITIKTKDPQKESVSENVEETDNDKVTEKNKDTENKKIKEDKLTEKEKLIEPDKVDEKEEMLKSLQPSTSDNEGGKVGPSKIMARRATMSVEQLTTAVETPDEKEEKKKDPAYEALSAFAEAISAAIETKKDEAE